MLRGEAVVLFLAECTQQQQQHIRSSSGCGIKSSCLLVACGRRLLVYHLHEFFTCNHSHRACPKLGEVFFRDSSKVCSSSNKKVCPGVVCAAPRQGRQKCVGGQRFLFRSCVCVC